MGFEELLFRHGKINPLAGQDHRGAFAVGFRRIQPYQKISASAGLLFPVIDIVGGLKLIALALIAGKTRPPPDQCHLEAPRVVRAENVSRYMGNVANMRGHGRIHGVSPEKVSFAFKRSNRALSVILVKQISSHNGRGPVAGVTEASSGSLIHKIGTITQFS
jgi:purine nucleoside phosphorylase